METAAREDFMKKPLPVKGYTSQSDEKIALVDDSKMIEELAMRQIDRHVRNHDSQEIDQRMVALARTHLQTAFMFLNRSVFQPKRLSDGQMLQADGLVKHLLGDDA